VTEVDEPVSQRELEGKVAIVTGAGRGIGAAVARELARAGARVVLAARSKDQLEAVHRSLSPSDALCVPTDVSLIEDLDHLAEATVAHFGSWDILVNNAGLMLTNRPIHTYSPDEWQETMRINLEVPWYLSNLAREQMKARGGGAIVHVASQLGMHHIPGVGLYGVSKAALIWLTTVQAKEWAADNIRVNCLAPGLVRTELSHEILSYLDEHGTTLSPLNLIAEPEDIAPLVRYLVSPLARYVTGENVRIDGGEHL